MGIRRPMLSVPTPSDRLGMGFNDHHDDSNHTNQKSLVSSTTTTACFTSNSESPESPAAPLVGGTGLSFMSPGFASVTGSVAGRGGEISMLSQGFNASRPPSNLSGSFKSKLAAVASCGGERKMGAVEDKRAGGIGRMGRAGKGERRMSLTERREVCMAKEALVSNERIRQLEAENLRLKFRVADLEGQVITELPHFFSFEALISVVLILISSLKSVPKTKKKKQHFRESYKIADDVFFWHGSDKIYPQRKRSVVFFFSLIRSRDTSGVYLVCPLLLAVLLLPL